jgi:transcriptional regulator with XRE-family HTH domain
MTPFGEKLRALRAARGATLKEMAKAIGVSAAYLSSLEHGRRGRPSWYLIQRIITYFNVIWDDADELVKLANLSHPRIVARTAGLSPRATELCNRLAANIHDLREDDLTILIRTLNEAIGRSRRVKPRE